MSGLLRSRSRAALHLLVAEMCFYVRLCKHLKMSPWSVFVRKASDYCPSSKSEAVAQSTEEHHVSKKKNKITPLGTQQLKWMMKSPMQKITNTRAWVFRSEEETYASFKNLIWTHVSAQMLTGPNASFELCIQCRNVQFTQSTALLFFIPPFCFLFFIYLSG